MRDIGLSIIDMVKMKELEMSKITIKTKVTVKTEWYLSRSKGSARNCLIDEEKSKFVIDLMRKNALVNA